MVKVNNTENPADFSFCKELFDKFGNRRLLSRVEYFAHSGEVMEYAVGFFQVASNIPSRLLTGTTGLLAFPSMIQY